MKLAFQLAYRNLMGAGLRTWLNASVLTFTFLMIIFFNGLMDGWNEQAKRDTTEWEYGFGHLTNAKFDPFDPFTLKDGNGVLQSKQHTELTPVLLQQASIYPQGRLFPVIMKGIDVDQKTLTLPTEKLKASNAEFPIMIGAQMAESSKLKTGDEILIRWRDSHGTFDAASATIVHVFKTNVPTVDRGQIWIPIKKMWEITGLENHATYYIASEKYVNTKAQGWIYENQDELLSTITELIETKKVGSSIMYILLLIIALLAIFDTQVLSVFRRQKEIGTYIALGMTRLQVVTLFTVEGSMYSLFAMVLGSIIGIPLMWYLAETGIAYPLDATQDIGIAISDRIFPVFGLQLIFGTIALIIISATIVSFLPARRIAKLNPVDALKGKMQ